MMDVNMFIGMVVQFFFLLTPFFVLSLFVSLTSGMELPRQRKLAVRTTLAVMTIVLIIYLLGDRIFGYLGISLDAFRIGAGLVLLLSGIEVVRSSGTPSGTRQCDDDGDIAVVPLAIPYTVGPGTIGTLLTMGASADSARLRVTQIAGIVIAVLIMGLLLYFSAALERLLKKKGLELLDAGKTNEAVECFSKGLVYAPFDSLMRFWRGRKLIGREEYTQSASDLKLAALENPED